MNESLLLAQNIARTCYDDITNSVVETTKTSVLDALGVSLAASTLGEGCRAFVDLALEDGGKKESTLIGFGARASARMAALANGALAHALDFEDAHDSALVHPNAATVPAALAIAESLGNVSGKELITAVAVGSDLVCRLGLALKQDLLEYGWYMPPILGAFGAAAAVSKLLRLSPAQITDAFSLTLCQAACSAELINSKRSVIRSVRDAFSAHAGVMAGLLAQRGVAGFDQPIEGQAGLFASYARGNYDPTRLTYELGRTYEGGNVSFKPWCSCRGTHGYIEAVLQILAEREVLPDEVNEVKVVVSPVNRMLCEPSELKRSPKTAIDAKFSIPFAVATAIVHRQVTLDQFELEALADERVLKLAAKVTYEVDGSLTRQQAVKGALHILAKNRVFSRQFDVARGHPSNPMSQSELIDKFANCARYAAKPLSTGNLNRAIDLVLNLERVERVGQLTEILCPVAYD